MVPTFHQGEEAVHLHAASGVRDAQGAAGDQALLRGAPLRGAHQTPARPLTRPLQQLHGLPHLDGQLAAMAGVEVLEDHGQLTSTGELGGDGDGSKCEGVRQREGEKECVRAEEGYGGERWDLGKKAEDGKERWEQGKKKQQEKKKELVVPLNHSASPAAATAGACLEPGL